MRRTWVAVGLTLATMLAHAQGNYFGGGDRPLSAFVQASYFSWKPGEIGLMVLWRGGERWYMQPGGAHGSGNFEGYKGSYTHGSTQIDFVFERQRRTARVNGVEASLSEGDNVLLVDGVDESDGRPSLRTIAADLSYQIRPGPGVVPAPPSPDDFASIVRRSPEIASFLQCEKPTSRQLPARFTGYICDNLQVK